jgi:hypothetical protein
MIRQLTCAVVNLQGGLGAKVDALTAKCDNLFARISEVEEAMSTSLDGRALSYGMSDMFSSPPVQSTPFIPSTPLAPPIAMSSISSPVGTNPFALTGWDGFVVSTFYVQWYKAGMWQKCAGGTSAGFQSFSKKGSLFIEKLNYFLDADHPVGSHSQCMSSATQNYADYMHLLTKVFEF